MRDDLRRSPESTKPKTYLYSTCKICGRKLGTRQRTSLGFYGDVCRVVEHCADPITNAEMKKKFRRK